MTWPLVDLAFWEPGEPGSAAVDALLADPDTPLARHGLTGIAARYAAETGAELDAQQRWWIDELTMKSLGVDGALSDVAPALDSAGVPWFTAKGPAVAYNHYPDPSMRPYTDLDVYVPDEDRAEAIAVLDDLGYRHVLKAVGALGGLPCEYHGGRFGAVIELHNHVVDNLHRRSLPSLTAWMDHVVRDELCGVGVNVLDDPAHGELQAIHLGAGHRFQKLVLLRDLASQPLARSAAIDERTAFWRQIGDKAAESLIDPDQKQAGLPRSLQRMLADDPATWDEHAWTISNISALTVGMSMPQVVSVALHAVRTRLRSDVRPVRIGPKTNPGPSIKPATS